MSIKIYKWRDELTKEDFEIFPPNSSNVDRKVVSEKAGSGVTVGTAFSGTIGEFTGLFLRTFNSIVFLNNPLKTWTKIPPRGNFPNIRNYQEVDIEIKTF